MISDDQRANTCNQIITGIGDVYKSMKAATVKISDGAQFTGSGVIVAVSIRKDRRTMIVATAAHNIRIFIQSLTTVRQSALWGVPNADLDLGHMNNRKERAIKAFMEGARIYYSAVNMTQDVNILTNGDAAITRVVLPDWGYDVCLIYAEVPATSFPKYSAVRSMDDVQEAVDLLGNIQIQNIAIFNQRYKMLQAGYGRNNAQNELSAGSLNFKLAEFQAGGHFAANYHDALTETNKDVFRLGSTMHWTSLPGDSGGPLFAVSSLTKKFYPIGVTLGSDVTQDADEDVQWEHHAAGAHNNAVTSLSRLYDAWNIHGREPAAVLLENNFTF